MNGPRRRALAVMIATLCILQLPRHSSADWQNPVGVCKDSRGCGSGSESVRGSNSSSGGGSMPWGRMTSRGLEKIKNCGDPLCWMIQGPIALTIGAVCDAPYYLVKGVGYGLYYGGRGLGKGLASIGRGIAYPFNRPPKPKLPPTTWEQYKHDVLKHQKALAKADKANKETQRWCVKNVPLEISPNRARWESICNAGDAVSRAALPPDIVALGLTPVSLAASPATVIVDGSAPFASPSSEAGQAPAAPGAEASEPPATSNVAGSDETLAAAPPVDAPIPPPAEAALGDTAPAEPNPAVSQQQAVQIGVAAGFSDGSVAIAGTAPAPVTRGKPLRTLPSATPANSLTPSEYGFEGRNGYAVKYNQVWGPTTPAESFIEKWNPMQTLTSIRKSINGTLRDRGTPFAIETAWEKTKEAAADLLKRVRGSANIVDRTKDTQAGRNVVRGYFEKLLEDDMALLNAAADGNAEHLLEANEERMNRSYADLQKDAVENTMGQAGDPLEKVKEHALKKTREAFPNAAPKNKPIEESIIYHWTDDFGHGGSKAKVVH